MKKEMIERGIQVNEDELQANLPSISSLTDFSVIYTPRT
jgi:hypothetical protein